MMRLKSNPTDNDEDADGVGVLLNDSALHHNNGGPPLASRFACQEALAGMSGRANGERSGSGSVVGAPATPFAPAA
jgi:hypothetical protein